MLQYPSAHALNCLYARVGHQEIDDILAGNRQLAVELEFDIRQQEAREEEAAAAEVCMHLT